MATDGDDADHDDDSDDDDDDDDRDTTYDHWSDPISPTTLAMEKPSHPVLFTRQQGEVAKGLVVGLVVFAFYQ